MNNLELAIDSIRDEYPELGNDEIATIIAEYIDSNLDKIIIGALDKLQIPRKIERRIQILKDKRRKARYRLPSHDSSQKEWLIDVITNLKWMNEPKFIDSTSWGNQADWLGKVDAWKTEDVGQTIKPAVAFKKYGIQDNISKTLEAELTSFRDNTFIDHEALLDINVNDGVFETQSQNFIETITHKANELSGNNVLKVVKQYNEDFGFLIEITLKQNDKDAFNTWLELLNDKTIASHNERIIVNWTLPNVLNDDDFINKSVEIMIKAGIPPELADKIDFHNDIDEWD